MNKKLVAVAIAGLLAAPLAQAQTANVTLYGRVNLNMEVVNAKGDTSKTVIGGNSNNVFRVSSNSSRFGLKGSESLGGGLTAIFQIESSVNADASGGTIAARETFVGLQGGWGTFKMGNFLSPYDDITPIFGSVPTLLTGILASQGIWGNNPNSNAAGGFDNRNPNSVRYDSPIMAGFNGSIQYSSSGTSTTEGQPRSNSGIWTVGGFYNNGPAQFGVAYTQNNSVRAAGLTDYAFSVAGAWNFGVFKIGGVWERIDYDVYNLTATPNVLAKNDLHRDFWAISTTINVGPGQMYASYGMALDGEGSALDGTLVGTLPSAANSYTGGGVRKGNDTGAYQWTLTYTYPLSKRTLMYTGFTQVANDDNATYNLNNPASGITPGANPWGFSMGTVHFF